MDQLSEPEDAQAELHNPLKCTSATRPPAPGVGDVIEETDTGRKLAYDGVAWHVIEDPRVTDTKGEEIP